MKLGPPPFWVWSGYVLGALFFLFVIYPAMRTPLSEDNPPRECRCCRKPVPYGKLACNEHWKMLPQPLRLAIISAYGKRAWKTYAENVREADKLWQDAGIWQPGVAQ